MHKSASRLNEKPYSPKLGTSKLAGDRIAQICIQSHSLLITLVFASAGASSSKLARASKTKSVETGIAARKTLS